MTRSSRCLTRAFIFATVVLAAAGQASAVIVIDRETGMQVRGYLIDIDERRVVIDELLADGSLKRQIYSRSEVDVERFVVPERLEELDPAEPEGYREYADELSEAKADPDARQTALRLYLVAAYLNPDELGRGALIAMTALSASEEEERRYRAMAYLLDPDRDKSLLSVPEVRALPVAPRAEDQAVLLDGLRLFWAGHKSGAARYAQREDFKQALAPHADKLTWQEFFDATKSFGEAMPPSTMRKVVSLTLALEGRRPLTSPPVGSPKTIAWSRLNWQHSASLRPLSLETITPFDPRANRYRDGKWSAE